MRKLTHVMRGMIAASALALAATPALAGDEERALAAIAEAQGKIDAAKKVGADGKTPADVATAEASLKLARLRLKDGKEQEAIKAAIQAQALADGAIGLTQAANNAAQQSAVAQATQRAQAAEQAAATAAAQAAAARAATPVVVTQPATTTVVTTEAQPVAATPATPAVRATPAKRTAAKKPVARKRTTTAARRTTGTSGASAGVKTTTTVTTTPQ